MGGNKALCLIRNYSHRCVKGTGTWQGLVTSLLLYYLWTWRVSVCNGDLKLQSQITMWKFCLTRPFAQEFIWTCPCRKRAGNINTRNLLFFLFLMFCQVPPLTQPNLKPKDKGTHSPCKFTAKDGARWRVTLSGQIGCTPIVLTTFGNLWEFNETIFIKYSALALAC